MSQPLWKRVWQFLIKLNLGSEITADSDCSHEVKRHLLLGRKTMTNLDSILKSRDITLPTKVHVVKAMVFSEVMYRCERWTIKKAKHQRIAFKMCAEEDLSLESPLKKQGGQTSQSWRKSTLNIHCKDRCWNSNTLATWCEELTHWKRPWCLERLKARGGGDRGWNGWMVSLTQWTLVWANSGKWWKTKKSGVLQFMWSQKVRHDLTTEQQQQIKLNTTTIRPNNCTLGYLSQKKVKTYVHTKTYTTMFIVALFVIAPN